MDLGSLKWLRQTVQEMHLKENTFFDFDHGIKVTLIIAQQLLYHVSCSPAKFLSCNVLPLRKKIHYLTSDFDLWVRSHEMLPSTPCIM